MGSQTIEEVTEIEMDEIKGDTKSIRILDIGKPYTKFLARFIIQ